MPDAIIHRITKSTALLIRSHEKTVRPVVSDLLDLTMDHGGMDPKELSRIGDALADIGSWYVNCAEDFFSKAHKLESARRGASN